jgi:hypothetical protein
MPDIDQLSDCAPLHELRDSMSAVTIPGPPQLAAITARGLSRRRHRRSAFAGLSLAGAAAGAALALGLTGAFSSAQPGGTDTIRTAAFTIVGHADGTATLTIDPKVLFEPSTLQNDLAEYGIQAIVSTGSFCSSDPTPAGFSQVVVFPPFSDDQSTQRSQDRTITINPAAMPAGTELSFGTFQLTKTVETAIALITTSSNTCTSTAPTTLPTGGALLYYPA